MKPKNGQTILGRSMNTTGETRRYGRGRVKEWKNGKHLPKWTCRIIWYDDGADDIRLEMVDCEHPREKPHNFFPESRAQADIVWALFKQNAPPEGMVIPVISKVLTELDAVSNED